MSFSLTNDSRENFIYSWEVILLLIFLHADKLEELKFKKRNFFLNSDPIPCSQDKWPRNLAPHAMICLSSITLIISSYEDRNQRRCLEDKKISLMFLEHLRTSSNNIQRYISLERQEKYVFCDIQNNQILRQPHKHACIYIQLYTSPPFFYLF